jgi:phage terminase small subunit
MFAEEYLACLNGTEAARRAGYGHENTNDNTLSTIASDNMRKPRIRAYIEERLKERAMPANEVLERLRRIAEADFSDFLSVTKGQPVIDLAKAVENGKGHLIKKVTITRRKRRGVTEEQITLELHDAHAALRDLGKYHALFTEKHEVSGEVTVKVVYGDDGDHDG